MKTKQKVGPTPGPWGYSEDGDEWEITADKRDGLHDGLVLGSVRPNGFFFDNKPGEIEANARLIAAAPDLLEAAKGGLVCAEALWRDSLTRGSDGVGERRKKADRIQAAIRKAEGSG